MSMARKAARHAIILMTSRILGMLIGIVSVLCYTRLFKPIELALIPILQILGQFCSKVSSLGLSVYVRRKMPQLNESDPATAKQLSRAYTAVMALGVLVSSFVIWSLSDSIARIFLKDPSRGVEIALLIPAIVFTMWSEVVLQIMRGRGLFIDISIYSFVVQLFHLPILIGLYLLFGRKGLVLGLAVAIGLGSIFMSWRLREYMFGKVSWSSLCQFIKDAFPFYGEEYIAYVTLFADTWIVGLFMTPVALAVYYVPKTICSRLYMLMEAVNSVLIANMSRVGSQGIAAAKAVFEKLRRLCIFVLVPAGIWLVAMSFYIIDVLAGPKYHAGAIPLGILCLAMSLRGVYAPHMVCVMTLAPPRKIFYAVLLRAIVLLLSMLSLVWLFDLIGIACAYVVARLTFSVMLVFFLREVFSFSADRHAVHVVFLPSILLILICAGGQLLFYHKLIVPLYMLIGLIIYAYVFVQRMSEDDVRLFESVMPGCLTRVRFLREFINSRVSE